MTPLGFQLAEIQNSNTAQNPVRARELEVRKNCKVLRSALKTRTKLREICNTRSLDRTASVAWLLHRCYEVSDLHYAKCSPHFLAPFFSFRYFNIAAKLYSENIFPLQFIHTLSATTILTTYDSDPSFFQRSNTAVRHCFWPMNRFIFCVAFRYLDIT